jgi:hypothetical protein
LIPLLLLLTLISQPPITYQPYTPTPQPHSTPPHPTPPPTPQELYATSRQLAACVVPHEYGLEPAQKLRIGAKIAAELVAKLLMDLASMQVGGGAGGVAGADRS